MDKNRGKLTIDPVAAGGLTKTGERAPIREPKQKSSSRANVDPESADVQAKTGEQPDPMLQPL